jgi:PadR family transcriptional regulator, regulatory protein PadR
MKDASKLGGLEQLILLAILRLGPDAYGVTIQREFASVARRQISLGAIYTTLDRLESKGYVSSTIGGATQERGGRAKRYFVLEAEGIKALQASLETLRALSKGLEPAVKGI